MGTVPISPLVHGLLNPQQPRALAAGFQTVTAVIDTAAHLVGRVSVISRSKNRHLNHPFVAFARIFLRAHGLAATLAYDLQLPLDTRIGRGELERRMRVKESHRDWLSIPAVAATLTLCSISVASSAHHAFAAEFDADKPFIVKGEVTRVKWVNPHSWLYFDVKSADGTLTNWGVEFGTPVQLASKGLTRTDLPIGSIVSVKGYRSKNGEPTGYSVTLTLADGRSFQTGAAQDVPSEPTKTASLVK